MIVLPINNGLLIFLMTFKLKVGLVLILLNFYLIKDIIIQVYYNAFKQNIIWLGGLFILKIFKKV